MDDKPKKDSTGKNVAVLFCNRCPSKILNSGAATFVNIDFALPHMRQAKVNENIEREEINEYWKVDNINNFENIGVSNTVKNVKYLACADCEQGPVGWHDLNTCRSYIALSRVRHHQPVCS